MQKFTLNVVLLSPPVSCPSLPAVISPKPIDQDPQDNYVGVLVAVFVAIIVLLVFVIVVIVSRHKKARHSDILGTLPHSLHQDTLTIDKRMNYNIKVRVGDGSI